MFAEVSTTALLPLPPPADRVVLRMAFGSQKYGRNGRRQRDRELSSWEDKERPRSRPWGCPVRRLVVGRDLMRPAHRPAGRRDN